MMDVERAEGEERRVVSTEVYRGGRAIAQERP